MYSVLDVARYVIAKNNQAGAISNLNLQKILYFIQAEFLVVQNMPCFAEQIEAWDFGPVVPVLIAMILAMVTTILNSDYSGN